MPPKSEEERIRAEVEVYIAPVLANLKTDNRPLSVRAVAKLYGRSRQTYYDYGLHKRLKAVKDLRKAAQQTKKNGPVTEEPLQAARADARHWESMYREVLSKLTILENHFLRHPTIDIDRIYRQGLMKPDRANPA